jgi:hypothetical protein
MTWSRANQPGAWASPRDNTLILRWLAGSTCHQETGGGRRETSVRWPLGAHGPARPDARFVVVRNAWRWSARGPVSEDTGPRSAHRHGDEDSVISLSMSAGL